MVYILVNKAIDSKVFKKMKGGAGPHHSKSTAFMYVMIIDVSSFLFRCIFNSGWYILKLYVLVNSNICIVRSIYLQNSLCTYTAVFGVFLCYHKCYKGRCISMFYHRFYNREISPDSSVSLYVLYGIDCQVFHNWNFIVIPS